MKKKIFIIGYLPIDDVTSFYKVEASTKKKAMELAYKQHNPAWDDDDDEFNDDMKDDFDSCAEVISIIKNTNSKNVILQ